MKNIDRTAHGLARRVIREAKNNWCNSFDAIKFDAHFFLMEAEDNGLTGLNAYQYALAEMRSEWN